MKTIFKIVGVIAGLGLACDSGDTGDDGPVVAEADARSVAAAAVGGTAIAASLDDTAEPPLWEVDVEMGNGGSIEAKIHADTADLLELEAFSGPFDYDFTPTSGVLSYGEMKAAAIENLPGEVEAWKFEIEYEEDEQEFEFEFYIRDAEDQLWEIKFDAVSGESTHVEKKTEVDE